MLIVCVYFLLLKRTTQSAGESVFCECPEYPQGPLPSAAASWLTIAGGHTWCVCVVVCHSVGHMVDPWSLLWRHGPEPDLTNWPSKEPSQLLAPPTLTLGREHGRHSLSLSHLSLPPLWTRLAQGLRTPGYSVSTYILRQRKRAFS